MTCLGARGRSQVGSINQATSKQFVTYMPIECGPCVRFQHGRGPRYVPDSIVKSFHGVPFDATLSLSRLRGMVIRQEGRAASPCWQGFRHPWNILVGALAPEILAWLRADDCFVPGTAAFDQLGLTFTSPSVGKSGNVRTEGGRKFIMSGSVGGSACCGSMCTMDVTKPIPSVRIQAWFRAFRAENMDSPCTMVACPRPFWNDPPGRGMD